MQIIYKCIKKYQKIFLSKSIKIYFYQKVSRSIKIFIKNISKITQLKKYFLIKFRFCHLFIHFISS